jgi:hypothetical protein
MERLYGDGDGYGYGYHEVLYAALGGVGSFDAAVDVCICGSQQ